jgi:predicted alpha/beta-fold hydrolase
MLLAPKNSGSFAWLIGAHRHVDQGHACQRPKLVDGTIGWVDGGYSSAAERLTVAQDVVGSIPTSRPNSAGCVIRPIQFCRAFVTLNFPVQPPAPREMETTGSAGAPAWFTAFAPRRGMGNGHVQTIVGNFLPRPAFRLPSTTEMVEVDPADGSRVLCHCHWQPGPYPRRRLTLVLVHGLEGSSDSRYIQGLTVRAWAAGCNIVRMNMRNCGDSDALTPTLYHSGLSEDVGAVVDHYTRQFGLERVALVGYSMGGNLVLKLAGEWGSRAPLCGVATVCPAIDLAAGSDALHEPVNRMYEWHFLRRLMRRYRRKAAMFPGTYQTRGLGPIRSLREFDNKVVARYCGFRDADDYYYRAASARVVDRIVVPTLVLRALDDPFIRLTPATGASIAGNRHITLIETAHGGHCAFLCQDAGDDIHWAESIVTRYLLQFAGNAHGS